MLKLYQKKSFKQSLKKYKHKDDILEILDCVIDLLVKEQAIPDKYKDHELKGKFKGVRELHLKPDDLLLYIKVEQESITLVDIGSHSKILRI